LDEQSNSTPKSVLKNDRSQSALDWEWSESWDTAADEPFGKVLLQVGDETRPCSHDWALVEMTLHKPNEMCSTNYLGTTNKQSLTEASRPPFQDGISDPVTMISGSHGPRAGELSSNPARIFIGNSSKFVNAYTLELNDGNGSFDPSYYLKLK
jgi:hypothetical protein